MRKYHRHEVTAVVAGMLSETEFQANCYRLELLLHIATSQCAGTAKVTTQQISHWLKEAGIFKAVFWHSILLASLVGVIVMFYSYVAPWAIPSP